MHGTPDSRHKAAVARNQNLSDLAATGSVPPSIPGDRIGPEGYGVYALAVSIGMWIEWAILAAFSRATIKLIGEARDWRPVAATALRVNLLIGAATLLLIWLAADGIAAVLGEAAVANPLRAYALVILTVTVTSVHSQVLIGTGAFLHRAQVSATYAVARLVLIVGLVWLGFGVIGAILGMAGASAAGVIVARRHVRPRWRKSSFPWRRLWSYAAPLFVFSIGQRVLAFLDLVLLKLLGGTTEQAGFYGAAQNVSFALSFVSLVAAPVLLSAVTRALRDDQRERAQMLAATSFRLMLIGIPLIATVCGCAGEVMTLVSGSQYLPAAVLVPPLAVAAFGRSATMITSSMQVAIGQPRLPARAILPLVPVALVAHALVIPSYGAIGAAMVSCVISVVGVVASVALLQRHWPVAWRFSTVLRSLMLTIAGYWLAQSYPTEGVAVVGKLIVLGSAVLAGYGVSGELTRADLQLIRELVGSRRV
ncbi:MAG TPA: oligosaccharide flippase family protein [Terriglobales bacterium]|nr:oligosaccharide flippase family protein [Terriglobales bacterium]